MPNVLELKPSEVFEFVILNLRLGHVPYIGGPPAIGKSNVVHQVGVAANAKLIDTRLSQKLPEDLTGLPERNEKTGKAYYLPFEEIPLEGDPIPEGYDGWIWFLDELSSATEEMLAAMYSAILDHTVGGHKIHPKCRIVAAGNLTTDSAIARELPDTLITRMVPCIMKPNNHDWLNWAGGFKHKNQTVIDFIEKNPTLLYSPTPPKDRMELETYATPRGWEKVMKQVNLHESMIPETDEVDQAGVPTGRKSASAPITDAIYNLMVGSVGPIAARTFREEYDQAIALPYAWEVAQAPFSAIVPSNAVGKAKMVEELAPFFLQSDSQNRENVLKYINRLGGEFAVLFFNKIESEVGQTQTDKKMLDDIQKRLGVDPVLGVAKKGGASSQDEDIPF